MSDEQEKIKKLPETVDPQEKLKLTVLHNAVVTCLKDYQTSSTTAKLNAWQSAETALKNYTDLLWAQYFAPEETLPTLLAVADYLNLKGWKAVRSTLYKHQKEGKLRPRADGSFLVAEMEKYAGAFLKRKDGSASGKLDQLQKDRLDATIRKEAAQARHWEIKTDILVKGYVPKDFFERELSKRAAVFKGDLENFARAESAAIIALVSGDGGKCSDLVELLIRQFGSILQRYTEEREFKPPPLAAATIDDLTITDEDDLANTGEE